MLRFAFLFEASSMLREVINMAEDEPAEEFGAGVWSTQSTLSSEDTRFALNESNANTSNVGYVNLEGSFLNVTRDVPIRYAMPLFGYIMPFLLLITIIANTLVVVVLAQRHMRSPTNLVLLAMAISDLLTLIFPSPWYFYMYTLGNHSKILYPPSACYAYHCMIEVIPAFFHTASIWLTLVLAIQRYIYVCHPTAANTCCAMPRVVKSVFWVYILSLQHQMTRFFDRSFEPVNFFWQGNYHWGCRVTTASWVKDSMTEDVYFTSYYGFRILFVHTAPCVTLVVLNVFLFCALKKAQKKRNKLFKANRKSESKKMRDSNSTTLMLIVVVTVFLAVEIPLAVTTFLHVMQNALDVQLVNYEYLNTTILFSNFFIMLSYPVNFAIYCGMSRQFRQTFTDLFMMGNLSTRRYGSTRYGSSRYSAINGARTETNESTV